METAKKRKLTKCDWCVLVVIVGMGASMLTPGITQAVEEKKLADLVSRLQAIRSDILLYQAEHNGLLPGQQFPNDIVTEDEFMQALREQRASGKGCYMQWLPDNPYVLDSESSNRLKCVNDPNSKPEGNEKTAWWFNGATGEFYAADSVFHTNY